MTRTKYHNAWLKKHPKYRNACRKKNYAKSRPIKRTSRKWTIQEEQAIFTRLKIDKKGEFSPMSDKEISNIINRSVQAIQQHRYILQRINA